MNDTNSTPAAVKPTVPNLYAGEFKSAIARAKRALVAAGLPWSVTTGRYSPYFNEQKTTRGLRVTRLGCSDTVTVNVWGDYAIGAAGNERRDLLAKALEVLRAAGLPFDDRGWLECGPKAARKLAALSQHVSACLSRRGLPCTCRVENGSK
jgi:hypothetical protein